MGVKVVESHMQTERHKTTKKPANECQFCSIFCYLQTKKCRRCFFHLAVSTVTPVFLPVSNTSDDSSEEEDKKILNNSTVKQDKMNLVNLYAICYTLFSMPGWIKTVMFYVT